MKSEKKLCSVCQESERRNTKSSYCTKCHAEYMAPFMRVWRKTHKLSGESKIKALARQKSRNYFKRGKILKTPCNFCGDKKTEMHHEDYSKPLDVMWLCKSCHLKIHKKGTYGKAL